MRQPSHPGVFFSRQILKSRNLTQKDASAILNVNKATISSFCKGKTRVTVRLAAKLATALDMNPLFWLNMQAAYDAYEAEHIRVNVDLFPLPEDNKCIHN